MSCLNPLSVRKLNGQYVSVPCKRCIPCRKRRAKDLALLCSLERYTCAVRGQLSSFLTLTYSPARLPVSDTHNPTLRKADFQKFMKRFRYYLPDYTADKFKTVQCGEYGDDDGLPHYHVCFLGLDSNLVDAVSRRAWSDHGELVGIVDCGPLVDGGVSYIVDYVLKSANGDLARCLYDDRGIERPFFNRSQRIGMEYIYSHLEEIYNNNFVVDNFGRHASSLPSYVRDYYALDPYGDYDPLPFLRSLAVEADKSGLSVSDYSARCGMIQSRDYVLGSRRSRIPVDDSEYVSHRSVYIDPCTRSANIISLVSEVDCDD